MASAASEASHVSKAVRYARDVVAGRIPACSWTVAACRRHLDDLERFKGSDSPYRFDRTAAERVCSIVEHFPHVKGVWAQARRRLELEPWQAFIVCAVFGWKNRADGSRRFRTAYVEVPRKNAKSTLTSALGNYLVACDGEHGAHVVSAASTRDQAKIVFNDAQLMARREAGFRARFGVEVLAHVIAVPETAGKFEAISAEDSNLDGLNLHAALIDELHAHKTRGVWDVLETATGARAQPLLWAITTAGVDRSSICYEQRTYVTRILERACEDESYFGVIYAADEGDDWRDEAVWRKANPNYGVSIYPEKLAFAAKKATQMPSALSAFQQKHLDIWVNADLAWMPMKAWHACGDTRLDLEDFQHETCFVGIDLATRSDICAVALLFPPTKVRPFWASFVRCYLPEDTLESTSNAHYSGWESEGFITTTDGNVTDFDAVLDDLDDLVSRFDIREIGYDPYQALPLVNAMQKRGFRMPRFEVRQTIVEMSAPMKELEALVISGKLRHDANPVQTWMMSNVVAHSDGKGNITPQKERDENKIDGPVALIIALNRALKNQKPNTPDYAARGGLLIL